MYSAALQALIRPIDSIGPKRGERCCKDVTARLGRRRGLVSHARVCDAELKFDGLAGYGERITGSCLWGRSNGRLLGPRFLCDTELRDLGSCCE